MERLLQNSVLECCVTFQFIQLCSHCRSPALRKRQQSRGLRSVAGDAQSSAVSSENRPRTGNPKKQRSKIRSVGSVGKPQWEETEGSCKSVLAALAASAACTGAESLDAPECLASERGTAEAGASVVTST